jgi:hypothetical protein
MTLLFYFLLFAGSLAFGLEALMLGMGGKIITLYKERPFLVLGLSTLLGFWIVILSLAFGLLFALEPLYVCGAVLVFTLLAGKLVHTMKPELVRRTPPTPKPLSDKEIREALRKRGLMRRKA